MELCRLHRIEQGSDDFITDCGKELYFPDADDDFKPNKEFNFCCYCGKPMNKAALKLKESAPTSTNTASDAIALCQEIVTMIQISKNVQIGFGCALYEKLIAVVAQRHA